MIELSDIQSAIAGILTKNGHTVTAAEVKQGFAKPTFFIDVLPVSTELHGKHYETITVSVELTYHPDIETREELLRMSGLLKSMFLYGSIPVKERFLSPNGIVFDTDQSALTAYFELTFMQETNIQQKPYPKMKTLQTEVAINHGTSPDTDSI